MSLFYSIYITANFLVSRLRITVVILLAFQLFYLTDSKADAVFVFQEALSKIEVKGLVKDINGMPLPGASIVEKGTTNGTQSDYDGNFLIGVAGSQSTLVISYTGYITQEIQISELEFINVTLLEDVEQLGEVVVVGYGTKKKINVTGSVSDIKSGEILESKTANVANNLTGRVAGLVINTRGGEPGSEEISMLIRGVGTTGNNTPLFVIDGVTSRGSFERLNPEDIESISVLKDASAAIYGAQAANGVILVTTKRGKEGKPVFSHSQSYSISQPTRRPYLMDALQYLTWIDERNIRNDRPTEFQQIIRQYRNGSIDNSVWGDTDWWDIVTDDWSPQLNYTFNVRGGNKNVRYFVSSQFLNQDAIYVGNSYGYKQYNIRSNLDINLTKNLQIGVDLSARIGDNKRPTLNTNDLIRQIFVQAPYEFPFFENGLITKTSAGNPISLSNGNSGNKRTNTNQFDSKFSFKWDMPFITKGLFVEGYATVDYYQTLRKDLSKPFDQYEYDELTGEYINLKYQTGNINLFQQSSVELNRTFNIRLGYDRIFDKHTINAFVAFEQFKQYGEYFYAYRQDLISEDIPYLFTGSDDNQNNGGKGYQNARLNYFGRINYNYYGKYLVDFTLRYDGSANFAPGNRFGLFPGLSLGWRISNESFFKSSLFDDLKIRASWGLLGNDRVASFQYLQYYLVQDSYIFGENPERIFGLTPNTTPNPNITWETAEKYNIGIDVVIKNRLLSGSIDVFYEKRSDILAPRNASVPVYTGLELPDENIGKVANRGLEIELNHKYNYRNLNYTVGGQFTYSKSEILFIDEAANIPEWQKRTGRPVDFVQVYEAVGIYNNQDEIDNSVHFPDAKPGDVHFVDQNGDGILDQNDQVILDYSPTPRIVYGFNFSLNWKNIDLNIFFQGQAQSQTIYRPWDLNQQSQFYTERWVSERLTPNARFPAAYDLGSSSFQEVSTVWVRNNDFLRLKNVELSYTFGEKSLKTLGLNSCRIFVSAYNLLIIYDNVEINDPESTSSTGWFYPPQRLLTAGFNVSF